jgi:hypothetical protein
MIDTVWEEGLDKVSNEEFASVSLNTETLEYLQQKIALSQPAVWQKALSEEGVHIEEPVKVKK